MVAKRSICHVGILARVSESGRLSISAKFRKAIGLKRGGEVVVELDGREIRIRTIDEVVGRAQAFTRQLIGEQPDPPWMPFSPSSGEKLRANDPGGSRRFRPSGSAPR
jgi:bifunctional DNA-binding transcriptional regulator/antitoxin component of YhaV-PrlF toxin-antitoxin module